MIEETIRRSEKHAKAIDLLGGFCQRCGSTEDLEFDHINKDREDDRHLMSQLWASSWSRILLELTRCQLLCKNCHTIKSLEERGLTIAKHGTQSRYGGKHRCRCVECKEAHLIHNSKYPDYHRRVLA